MFDVEHLVSLLQLGLKVTFELLRYYSLHALSALPLVDLK